LHKPKSQPQLRPRHLVSLQPAGRAPIEAPLAIDETDAGLGAVVGLALAASAVILFSLNSTSTPTKTTQVRTLVVTLAVLAGTLLP
jgi:hypothetical protein